VSAGDAPGGAALAARTAAHAARGSYRRAVVLVVLSAVVLSSNGLIFRSLADSSVWQIIFYRGAGLFVAMSCLFLLRHRRRAAAELRRARFGPLVGGSFLGLASVSFYLALTYTTVANTLFTLSSVPLFAAVLGWLVLGEHVRRATWIAIGVAMAGIGIMVADGLGSGELPGNILALICALMFAVYVITLRRGRHVDMLPAVCIAALVAAGFGAVMADGLDIPPVNIAVCLAWGGGLSCLAHFFYTMGSRQVPAADLTLLSLAEFVLGPIWVWFFMGETPGALSLAGGAVVFVAITAWSYLRLREPAVS
jgi:drug/metabolite transporter (DMT)-like permease